MFDYLDLCTYAVLGSLAGFLGGLLGIGGGFVLVPGLYAMFNRVEQFPEHALPMALGTTMCCIIFTASSAVRANAKRGFVRFDVLGRFAPWVSVGCVIGAYLATVLASKHVKLGFAAFCLYSAARMFFSGEVSHTTAQREIETSRLSVPGVFFGSVCGMIGVGGANLFVPFMLKRKVALRNAIATASALQIPIATAGSLGYIALGRNVAVGARTLGFIYLPALFAIVLASMAFAPLGVAVSHAVPVPALKKLFACVTAAIGLKMAGFFTLVSSWLL